MRRTTTIDVSRTDDNFDHLIVRAVGRDITTHTHGARDTAEQSLSMNLDGAGRTVTAIESLPPFGLDSLVGTPVGSGFRRRLGRVLSADALGSGLLYSLLDQLPGAVFLIGYTRLLDNPSALDPAASRERFAAQVDICSGYVADGTIGTWVSRFGHSPLPRGSHAPVMETDDASAWHTTPQLEPLSLRRARLVDVRATSPNAPIEVVSTFRDTNVDRDGAETVLHEYMLNAEIDSSAHKITSITATPTVLPWQECTVAAASAARVIGVPVAELRGWVSTHLSGPTTCTHLNEALRFLEDLDHLLDHLPARGHSS